VPADYDVTCAGVAAWPEPVDGTYEDLYLITDGTDGLEAVPYHTMYNTFVEGDAKRAIMDLADGGA
jgi:hypothetical protein